MWRHTKKVAICQPGREPSPGTEPASALTLDFPASRTVRINFFCVSHSAYGICYGSPTGRKCLSTASNHLSYLVLLLSVCCLALPTRIYAQWRKTLSVISAAATKNYWEIPAKNFEWNSKKGFLALIKVERTLLLHLLKASHLPAFTSKESKCFQNVAQMKYAARTTPYLNPMTAKWNRKWNSVMVQGDAGHRTD